MPKFRKKPVVVDAVQYVFDGEEVLPDMAQDAIVDFMEQNIMVEGDDIIIPTLEGEMRASPGDWIIKGVKGEFYPCKPDIFAATYEPAEAA
jgi:hypothetical protein